MAGNVGEWIDGEEGEADTSSWPNPKKSFFIFQTKKNFRIYIIKKIFFFSFLYCAIFHLTAPYFI